MKVLILKPSSLGDVIQALPVLRLIKLRHPHSQVYWWLNSDLLPLLEGDPDLAGIIPFERKKWRSPLRWKGLFQSIREIRAHKFDWVIDLQSLARSGAVAWLANGGLTIGLDDPREGAASYYDMTVRRPSPKTHAVDWYLSVLPLLKVPVHDDFDWLPRRPSAAESVRKKWQPGPRRWLVLNPGARWLNKRWPAEYFADLARRLAGAFPEFRIAITGGNDDREMGEGIRAAAPEHCLDLTGRTTLPEMIEWIRRAELMVTNDTGPMHVAAALRKPVVGLFGPTEPSRTGPYRQMDRVMRNAAVPCVPCMKDFCSYIKPIECLRSISPEMVFARVKALLENKERRTSPAPVPASE